MSTEVWRQEAQRVLDMDNAERQKWVASLLFELTIMARSTYTVGGEGLDDPPRMRQFNELMHRAAGQLQEDMCRSVGRPYEDFLEMVGEEVDALGFSANQLVNRLQ